MTQPIPKIGDMYLDGEQLREITDTRISMFKVGEAGSPPTWVSIDDVELYAHSAGTRNYWRMKAC